jgi:voltage-dependent calcium channel L type alpha-1S
MTNDDWIGINEMGSQSNITFTFLYCVSMMYVVNLMTYGLTMAILLDAFGKYLEEEEENEDNEFIQQKTKTKQ